MALLDEQLSALTLGEHGHGGPMPQVHRRSPSRPMQQKHRSKPSHDGGKLLEGLDL